MPLIEVPQKPNPIPGISPILKNFRMEEDEGAFTMFSKRPKVSVASGSEPRKLTMKQVTLKPESERFTFSDLGLNEWVVKCVNSMGIVKPTPVQVRSLILYNGVEDVYSRSGEWKECNRCIRDRKW